MNQFLTKKLSLLGGTLCAAAIMSLSSCSSDEPINQMAGTTTSKSVSFSADGVIGSVKKIYYGDPILPIYWSANDQITVLSATPGMEQTATYTTGSGVLNNQIAVSFSPVDGTTVEWDEDAATQTFYAYYPAGSYTALGTAAIFDVPSIQGGAHPNSASDPANSLSFAVASRFNVPVPEDKTTPVNLSFNAFLNVLRLTLNNSEGLAVENIVVSSPTAGQNVSGPVVVTPAGASFNFSSTSGSPNITVAANSSITPQSYNIYLRPLDYAAGVTISVNYAGGENKTITTQAFPQSTVKDVTINLTDETTTLPSVQPEQSKDMGILVRSAVVDNVVMTRAIATYDYSLVWVVEADGRVSQNLHSGNSTQSQRENALGNAVPLYWADGNLLIPGTPTNPSGGAAHIVSVTSSTEVTATGGYALNSYSWGLFRHGLVSGWGGTAPGTIHTSGNPDYDIARNRLVGPTATGRVGWRLPTAIEWTFLMELNSTAGSLDPSWSASGNNYSAGAASGKHNCHANGIFTITGANGEKIYLPAMGARISSSEFMARPTNGYYLSGSSSSTNPYFFHIYASGSSWSLARNLPGNTYGFAVRPVSE